MSMKTQHETAMTEYEHYVEWQKKLIAGAIESAHLDALEANPKPRHSESCAYHAGGDCSCGATPWPEDYE